MTSAATDPTYQPAPPRSIFRSRWPLVVLVVLTLIGAGLRFVAIDRPAIWGDESATAGRIIGSHENLLDQLAEGTFTPMHYQLGWWIAQGMPYWGDITESGEKKIFTPTHRLIEGGIPMTPFFLRLVPAIAGTLMIPAIYFLSRQLFGPRVSLLAAAVCCFSAYLLIYSRDAKMYMPLWLFCTLNVGCLLWWLRVRTWTAWLCWVAAGCAMIGFHSLGLIVVAVNVLIWLTAPRQHWMGLVKLFLLIGWPLLLLAVSIYELLRKKFDLMVWWRFRDVLRFPITMWPRFHFPTVLLFALGLYVMLLGRQFYVESFNERFDKVLEEGEFNTDVNGTGWVGPYNAGRKFGSLALYTTSAYLTGWEWPRNQVDEGRDDESFVNPRTLKLLKASVITLLALLAIGVFPWRRIFQPAKARLDRIAQDGVVDSKYVRRRVLWIGFWLIIPAFALYSQSVAKPAFVLDAVSQLALKAPAAIDWPRLPRPEPTAKRFDFYTASTTWRPLAEALGQSWTQFVEQFQADDALHVVRLTILGVVGVAILVAMIWRRKTIGHTSLRLLIATAIVLLICGLLTIAPRFPDKSVWMPRYVGVVYPAFAIAIAVLIARLPSPWLRGGALVVFIVINMGNFYARVFTPSEPPVDRIAADIIRSHQSTGNTFRTYVAVRHRGAEPGMGTFPSSPASYYLWLEADLPNFRGRDVRWGRYPPELRVWEVTDPFAVARDLERSDKIERFVVWSSFDFDATEITDPVQDKLAGKFRRVSDEVTPVFDHTRWMHLYNMRRREYVRVGV